MTTDKKAEGSTGGGWTVEGPVLRNGNHRLYLVSWTDISPEELADFLNRGEDDKLRDGRLTLITGRNQSVEGDPASIEALRARLERSPTESSLRALREAFDAGHRTIGYAPIARAIRAVLSSSAAEPPKPEPELQGECFVNEYLPKPEKKKEKP